MLVITICLMTFQEPKSPDYLYMTPKSVRAGSTYYIARYDARASAQPKYIPGYSSTLWIEDWERYEKASDAVGMKNMLEAGKVYLVKPGDSAKAISAKEYYVKGISSNIPMMVVRMIDGDHKDQELIFYDGRICDRIDDSAEKALLDAKKAKDAQLKKMNDKQKKENAEKEAIQKAESTAADLLASAKRWLSEGSNGSNRDIAKSRLQDLLKRFPDSKAAPEAKKLLESLK